MRKCFLFVLCIPLIISNCKKNEIIPLNDLLPAPLKGHQIIEHNAYTLSYNEDHEQADWVAYVLTKENVENNSWDRTNNYREDPAVLSSSAYLSDYEPTNHIFARGHLAPAGDFKWSQTAMSESFFLSNISPMLHEFNSGKWMYLENEVRHWAVLYEKIYIAVGGILSEGLDNIGENKVSVPKYFFKVIVDIDGEKGIAFIMPNKNIDDAFKNYAVTIDEVEKRTGLDFLYGLENELEDHIESTLNMSKWSFDYYK